MANKSSDLITGSRAKKYDSNWRLFTKNFVYRKIAQRIKVKKDDKIADIGCGTGDVLKRLSEKYGESVKLSGIDPSADMIKLAKDKLGNKVELLVAPGEELPYKTDSIDIVISTLTFHHMAKAVKQETLNEIKRVLKDNGRLYISDWGKPTNLLGKILVNKVKNHSFVKDNLQGSIEDSAYKVGFVLSAKSYVQAGCIHHLEFTKKDFS